MNRAIRGHVRNFRDWANKWDSEHFAGEWGYCVFVDSVCFAAKVELYSIVDYIVSSNSGGLYWLVRRK